MSEWAEVKEPLRLDIDEWDHSVHGCQLLNGYFFVDRQLPVQAGFFLIKSLPVQACFFLHSILSLNISNLSCSVINSLHLLHLVVFDKSFGSINNESTEINSTMASGFIRLCSLYGHTFFTPTCDKVLSSISVLTNSALSAYCVLVQCDSISSMTFSTPRLIIAIA